MIAVYIVYLFIFFRNKIIIKKTDSKAFLVRMRHQHMLSGCYCVLQVVTVNCARIIHANQVATNGVVHVIDRVISAVGNSIRDVIQSNEELSLLRVCDVA